MARKRTGDGSRLQPQQPDDQYPGVPEQGWKPIGPDSAGKIKHERSLFGEKIERMLRQAQKNPNQHGMCPFKPEEVGDILMHILLLSDERAFAVDYARRLEEQINYSRPVAGPRRLTAPSDEAKESPR